MNILVTPLDVGRPLWSVDVRLLSTASAQGSKIFRKIDLVREVDRMREVDLKSLPVNERRHLLKEVDRACDLILKRNLENKMKVGIQ